MDFSPTDEQNALSEVAARLMPPPAPGDSGRVAVKDIDTTLWAKLSDSQLLGTVVPEKHGGLGFGVLELCLVLEACGRSLARVPLLETSLGCLALAEFADSDIAAEILAGVVGGRMSLSVGTFGSTPEGVRLVAKSVDQGFVVRGTAALVPYGALVDWVIVPVQIGERSALVLVDPRSPEVTTIEHLTTSGRPEATLKIDELVVEASAVFGDAVAATWLWERSVVGTSALLVGIADGALHLTANYTNSREQFGRTLSTFQAVAVHAGTAYIDVEAMRVSTLLAAWRLSAGLDAASEVATAKLWASDGSARVTATAQHLHGGIGVTTDYPVHEYLLWAKHLELTGGSAAHHLHALATG